MEFSADHCLMKGENLPHDLHYCVFRSNSLTDRASGSFPLVIICCRSFITSTIFELHKPEKKAPRNQHSGVPTTEKLLSQKLRPRMRFSMFINL